MIRFCRKCGHRKSCAKNRRICKSCEYKRVRIWVKNNRRRRQVTLIAWRAKNPLMVLRARLRSEYGFSDKTIEKILKWKGGKCICGKKIKRLGKGWDDGCIDHNHKTGKFRGIICSRCNWVLGIVEESIEILNILKRYLKKELK